MSDISHKQAIRLIHRRLDGLLNDDQRRDLEAHLRDCEACRAETESLSTLTVHLQSEFHARWDAQNGPSTNVMTNVHSQTRRIMVMNRINGGLRAVAGITALLVLGLAINFVILQLRNISTSTNGTQNAGGVTPVSSPQANDQLLAFTSVKDGNYDIYTMHADGTGLTNLTNNVSYDSSPFWSPDGTRIAFESGRDGSWGQIYLMNADGSNVVQLTNDPADHQFIRNYGASSSPWSPDGSRLIISQRLAGEEKWTLYTVDASGENKTPLVSEPNIYNALSWSPDGRRIAFIADDPQTIERDRLYVVNADGSDRREITKSLQQNGQLYNSDYSWSSDGQSIFFTAFFQKTNPNWTVYEVNLNNNTLVEKATTNQAINDWQDGTLLVTSFQSGSPIQWLRSDGTSSTLYPYENCEQMHAFWSGSYMERSPNGNWAINSYCPNGDFWFYYVNSDGTIIKPLLNSPVSAKDTSLIDITWSPDDKFIIFEMASSDKPELYILNIAESLKDPSIRPLQVAIGDGSYGPDWQPVVHHDIVEEEPTQTDNRLLAFTKATDGNLDIYTIRADGSGSTNLTNNTARDANPIWSPDGRRIAFESDRDGSMQIYLMNANGTDVIQLTHDEADHGFNVSGYSPWSPDGSRLIFTQRAPGEEKWILYAVGVDGQNKTPLVEVPDIYSAVSWSPDGEHIAFIILEPQESRDLARIHVVDVNGNNLTNATKLVPVDEDLSWNYSWSRDGQFISFIAGRYAWENGKGRYAAYEASLDGETLVEKATSSTPMEDWRDGTSFITGFDASTLTWLRSDGTYNTLKPFEKCRMADGSQYGSIYERSFNGNLVYGANCPNGDWWFYWANPDGTVVKQLLNSPTTFSEGSITEIVWSPDNKFFALNVASPDRTDIYILNVEKALKDPFTQPEQIVVGVGTINFNISGQPIP